MRLATVLFLSLAAVASDLEAWRRTVQQADVLHERGQLREAAVLLESAVRQARDAGAVPDAVADSKVRLASIDVDLGEYPSAERLYLDALRVLSGQPGGELTRSIAQAGLAATYSHLGEWTRAEKYAQMALASQTAVNSAESPELAGQLVLMAGIYQAQHRDRQAEETLRPALPLLGDGTPARAVALANLALLLRGQDRMDDAIAAARQAIQIWEQRQPDPRQAQALTILASLYGRQGRWNDALSTIETRSAQHRTNVGAESSLGRTDPRGSSRHTRSSWPQARSEGADTGVGGDPTKNTKR